MIACVAACALAIAATAPHADDHEGEHHDEHEHGDEHEAPTFSVHDFEEAGVTLLVAGPGEVDLGVELPGEVRPNADRIAHVAPRFPGIAREVKKYVGDSVRAGDVLAVIESENLSTYELRAAFDGTVIDKHIAPGEAVSREETAYIVADLSSVWVILNVYQEALPQVRIGQPVWIRAANGSAEAESTVSYVAPIVDQATRTASARAVLPNPDGTWRPGLFVTATALTPVKAAVAVPRTAVQTFEGRPTLFVADGDRFEPRAVTLGRLGRNFAEVTSGLAPGERYAADRSFLVKAELAKGEAAHEH
jgi:cobalt-zinc-cadmium efflux system membrane fusion protein